MSNLFDGTEFAIPCPKCGHQTRKSIGWLKENTQFVCPNCADTITFQPEELLRGIAESEQDIEQFKRNIGNIGPIKIG